LHINFHEKNQNGDNNDNATQHKLKKTGHLEQLLTKLQQKTSREKLEFQPPEEEEEEEEEQEPEPQNNQ